MSDESNYNRRARAAEVLVEAEARVIRRRETLRGVMAAEILRALVSESIPRALKSRHGASSCRSRGLVSGEIGPAIIRIRLEV